MILRTGKKPLGRLIDQFAASKKLIMLVNCVELYAVGDTSRDLKQISNFISNLILVNAEDAFVDKNATKRFFLNNLNDFSQLTQYDCLDCSAPSSKQIQMQLSVAN